MSTTPKLVYVAGPFSPTRAQKACLLEASGGDKLCRAAHRACVEENIANAVQLGLKVTELGACPWIPHANTAHPDFESIQDYHFWIAATAEQLRRCDAVIFTDDYKQSSGAQGENQIAIENAIPRFFNLADLATWLRSDSN